MKSALFPSLLIWLASASAASAWEAPMRQTPLMDTVLNMTAYTINAPANWVVEGAMVPNPSCTGGGPLPTYRATAPDGLTGVLLPPRYDWGWGPAVSNRGDCLPLRQTISARDFLTYYIRIKQLGFVREEAVPQAEEHRRNVQGISRPGFQVTLDEARFRVRYQIGRQTIDEIVGTAVMCNEMSVAAVGIQHHCNAGISRMFAPTGQLDSLMPTLKSVTLQMNPQWNQQWNAVTTQRIRGMYEAQTQAMLQRGRQAEAARMREHQAFMASMQRGADLRDQQFRDGQFVKQQNKEEYVDYLLDCHRLSDGGYTTSIGNCPNRETPPR